MSETRSSKPRVAVLFGGQSGEHQVSCATAASVLASIDRDRYDVIPIGITPDGAWVRVPDDPSLYEMRAGQGAVIEAGNKSVSLWAGTSSLVERGGRIVDGEPLAIRDLGNIDVVFPLLHGPYGEDGTIQGLFESHGVRYVGCGVASSAICMDKHLAKTVLLAAGIAVGRWTLITDHLWTSDRARAIAQAMSVGSDLYVKPVRAGSSLGITHVTDLDTLGDAIEHAREHDPRVIVEKAVHGREIECGVLDYGLGKQPQASECGEISVRGSGFYDYKTKYQAHDSVTLSCPADISHDLKHRIQEIAVDAFLALGCEGLARVDFFYDEANDALILNEVNTLPGFTPWSMYPTMWEASGMHYGDLITHLIELALHRRAGLR
ncbi:MAG: D-alanine--D-alanine ligase family protein [Actinomycetaceae bacterium]|nr:D-alanine--D-alanine ligase family protein [Actinomycetaceae bacterium]